MRADYNPDFEMRPGYGIVLRLIAILLLSSMVMLVKVASDMGVHSLESLFYRFSIGFLSIVFWMAFRGELASVKTKRLPLHVCRTFCGVISMALSFYAATLLPLPEFATISFTMPIIMTILSIIFLKEVVRFKRWTAMIIGLIGVLIVVQPGQNQISLTGALMAVGGVIAASYTLILVKHLSTTESSTVIVFWYTLLAIPAAGIAMFFVAKSHKPIVWLIMVGIGLFGAIGQVALAESLKFAPISLTAPIDYSNLLWSTAYGYLIWEYWPGASMWIGAPIIIAAGLYVARRSESTKKLPVG